MTFQQPVETGEWLPFRGSGSFLERLRSLGINQSSVFFGELVLGPQNPISKTLRTYQTDPQSDGTKPTKTHSRTTTNKIPTDAVVGPPKSTTIVKVGIPVVEGAIAQISGVALCAVVPVYEAGNL